jgi:hypothetical protein
MNTAVATLHESVRMGSGPRLREGMVRGPRPRPGTTAPEYWALATKPDKVSHDS